LGRLLLEGVLLLEDGFKLDPEESEHTGIFFVEVKDSSHL